MCGHWKCLKTRINELKSQDSDFYLMKDFMDSQTSREKKKKYIFFPDLCKKVKTSQIHCIDTLQIIDYTSPYLV